MTIHASISVQNDIRKDYWKWDVKEGGGAQLGQGAETHSGKAESWKYVFIIAQGQRSAANQRESKYNPDEREGRRIMYCTVRSSTRPRWFCSILTKSEGRSGQLTDCTPPALHQPAGDGRRWWRVWRNVRTGRVRSGSDYTAAGKKERESSAAFLRRDPLCSAHQHYHNWTLDWTKTVENALVC